MKFALLLKYPPGHRIPAAVKPYGHGWYINRHVVWGRNVEDTLSSLRATYPHMKYDLVRIG